MGTPIEQRAVQIGPERLGEPWGPIVDLAPGVRLAPYYNALLVEIHGDTWVLPEGTVADKFLAAPV